MMTPEQLHAFIRETIAARQVEPADGQKIVARMQLRFVSGNDDRPLLYSTAILPEN